MRVRHSARNLTDGGGPVLLRKLFDRLTVVVRYGRKQAGAEARSSIHSAAPSAVWTAVNDVAASPYCGV